MVSCPDSHTDTQRSSSYLWRVSDSSNHLLNHLRTDLFPWLTHTDSDVAEQRWVADIGRVAVTDNVGSPFVFGGIGVTSSDVAGLKGFEVLEGAEFVGHFDD